MYLSSLWHTQDGTWQATCRCINLGLTFITFSKIGVNNNVSMVTDLCIIFMQVHFIMKYGLKRLCIALCTCDFKMFMRLWVYFVLIDKIWTKSEIGLRYQLISCTKNQIALAHTRHIISNAYFVVFDAMTRRLDEIMLYFLCELEFYWCSIVYPWWLNGSVMSHSLPLMVEQFSSTDVTVVRCHMGKV